MSRRLFKHLVKLDQAYFERRTLAFYKKHATYKRLPRHLEMWKTFFRSYGSGNSFWVALKSAIKHRWVMR